jgi:MFS family permease
MNAVTELPAESEQRHKHAFIAHFMLLSVISGITIGMGKVATTFFALHRGADTMQIGIISAMESLGMLLVTVPAGFLIARFGARRIYFISSLGPMVLSAVIPWLSAWYAIALARGLIGLCIPFRIVSMNSSFLQELKRLGSGKSGWYRGALTLGIGFLGPVLGNFFTEHTGYVWTYLAIGALFGFMAFYSQVFLPGPTVENSVAVTTVSSVFAEVKTMLANVEIGASCLIEFISSSTNSLFSTFILLIAIDVAHLPQQRAILLMLVQGATAVAALFAFGPLLRRLPQAMAYSISIVLACIGLALLGNGAGFAALAAGTVALSAGAALVHLINMDQLSRHALDKSKISGLYNLAQMSGGFFGAMIGGVLSRYFGLQKLFLIWIPILLVAALFLRWRSAQWTALPAHAVRDIDTRPPESAG